MRVLVTGDRGRLGRDIAPALAAAGHAVEGFDSATGDDILDSEAVEAAVLKTQAVVHLAGIPEDRGGDPEELFRTNVIGTWNVLEASKKANVERVVYASSGKALGMLATAPRYLPVDDIHPGGSFRPYGLSKWLCEEMCEAFTLDTRIPTICLRPVLVLDEQRWPQFGSGTELPAASGAAWHLAAFVDQRDTVDAFVRAVSCEVDGHSRLLLCAADVGSDRSAAELADEHFPDVPWRDARPVTGSRRALVDCSAAARVLGWHPTIGWNDRPVSAGHSVEV